MPGGFVDLDRGGVQHAVHLAQSRFVVACAGDVAAQLLQSLQQGRRVVAFQSGQRVFAGLDQPGGVGVAAMVGEQIEDRHRFQRFAFQLAPLVIEQIDAVGNIARPRQRIALAQQPRPRVGSFAHRRQWRRMAAKGVQQIELAGFRQQRLMLVLTVDFDQQTGQLRQLRHRDRAAIDPGPRAAVRTQRAPQLTGVVIVELLFAQPDQRLGAIGQIEFRVQLSARGAVADHAAVGAQAGEKPQCVDQQRFAGAGFA